MDEIELRRAGGVWFRDDIIGGSWLEPDSKVVGMAADSADNAVSANVRFFGLGLGDTERWSKCEGEWPGTPMRFASNTLDGAW